MTKEFLNWVGTLTDKEHAGLIALSQIATASVVIILNQVVLKSKNLIPNSLWGLITRLIKKEPIMAKTTQREVEMELVKPFDTQALVAELKSKGLDVAEELVKVIAGATFDWTEKSLMIHENPYVKFAAPVVAAVKPLVMAEIDKIDGQVG